MNLSTVRAYTRKLFAAVSKDKLENAACLIVLCTGIGLLSSIGLALVILAVLAWIMPTFHQLAYKYLEHWLDGLEYQRAKRQQDIAKNAKGLTAPGAYPAHGLVDDDQQARDQLQRMAWQEQASYQQQQQNRFERVNIA